MRLNTPTLLLILLATQLGVTATEPQPTNCESSASEIVALLDAGDVDKLRSWFPENIASPPEYLPTIFRVLHREYGHPTKTTRDDTIDLATFTEQNISGRGLQPPFRTFKFRTVFHHEGDGIIAINLGLLNGDCRIAELIIGIPRSRPDSLRRFYEISTQIGHELAADAR